MNRALRKFVDETAQTIRQFQQGNLELADPRDVENMFRWLRQSAERSREEQVLLQEPVQRYLVGLWDFAQDKIKQSDIELMAEEVPGSFLYSSGAF